MSCIQIYTVPVQIDPCIAVTKKAAVRQLKDETARGGSVTH